MMKSPDQAKRWVVISALVVGGVWAYRRYKQGPQSVMQAPEFLTAWGATFFVLAMLAESAPRFAGMMAILVMTGDVLVNGQELSKFVQQGIQKPPASQTASQAHSQAPVGSSHDQPGSGVGHRG